MNCVIEGNCIKVFGKALHALSRIGDEVWLDPMVKGLALRSVNSAQSAYGCFLFSPLFFQQYSLGSFSEQSREAIKCKMVMKSVLPLFRCLSSIERSVEQCHISVNTSPDRVIIQFFCRHAITKTHNLGFQESEALQAVFDAHLCPNVLTAPARLLSDMVMHFSAFQEEVTLSMTPLKVCLRNYHEEGNGHMKVMHTEMSLHPDEFGYFQSGEDSDITFCLKELRGILTFAEARCIPVSVHFGAAGKPVCFSVQDVILEATVILATLTDSESGTPSQPPRTPTPTTPSNIQCVDPDGEDLIRSSQGSPITNPPDLMHLLPQINTPTRLSEDCASTTTTPTMVCSLLFKAMSSEHHDGGCADTLPVLVCCSDEEESDEDSYPNSFSL